jgi:hypothetical protein
VRSAVIVVEMKRLFLGGRHRKLHRFRIAVRRITWSRTGHRGADMGAATRIADVPMQD